MILSKNNILQNKFYKALCALLICVLALSGCAKTQEPLRVITLKGPTAMGMAPMIEDADDSDDARFEVAAAPDAVAPKLLKGEVDFAAVPANLAATLYQKSEGKIQVVAINTLGVLYLTERGEQVHSLKDLAGKTIVASGKGSTPEYALNFLLQSAGVSPDQVSIEWKSEHTEVVSALAQDASLIGLLPEPFVTVAKSKMNDLRTAIDLNAEWDKTQEGMENPSSMVMGVLVGRKDALTDTKRIQKFLKKYEESIQKVNQDPKDAAEDIGKLDIVPQAVAEKVIPKCNIRYYSGEEMKIMLSGFLKVLADQNPKAIGGQMPADDFYWIGK